MTSETCESVTQKVLSNHSNSGSSSSSAPLPTNSSLDVEDRDVKEARKIKVQFQSPMVARPNFATDDEGIYFI